MSFLMVVLGLCVFGENTAEVKCPHRVISVILCYQCDSLLVMLPMIPPPKQCWPGSPPPYLSPLFILCSLEAGNYVHPALGVGNGDQLRESVCTYYLEFLWRKDFSLFLPLFHHLSISVWVQVYLFSTLSYDQTWIVYSFAQIISPFAVGRLTSEFFWRIPILFVFGAFPYFLPLQDALDSSFLFRVHSWNQSSLPGPPFPLIGEWYLETNMWPCVYC